MIRTYKPRSEYVYDTPDKILAADMVTDLVSNLSGRNRKLDRLFSEEQVLGAIIASAVSGTVLDTHSVRGKRQTEQPSLFESPAPEDLLEQRILRAASVAGANTLLYTGICMPGDYLEFPNRIKLKDPESKQKFTANEWVQHSWVPDYTERFIEATSQFEQTVNGTIE